MVAPGAQRLVQAQVAERRRELAREAVVEEEQVPKRGRERRELRRDGLGELVGLERRRDGARELVAADIKHGEAAAPPQVIGTAPVSQTLEKSPVAAEENARKTRGNENEEKGEQTPHVRARVPKKLK